MKNKIIRMLGGIVFEDLTVEIQQDILEGRRIHEESLIEECAFKMGYKIEIARANSKKYMKMLEKEINDCHELNMKEIEESKKFLKHKDEKQNRRRRIFS